MSIKKMLAWLLVPMIVILLVVAGLSFSGNYSVNEAVNMPSDI